MLAHANIATLSAANLWQHDGRIPDLHTLHLSGVLGDGILAPFCTTTKLIIGDALSTLTTLQYMFDPQQGGLMLIVTPPRFKQAVKEFCAARLSLDLGAPTHEEMEGRRSY